MDNTCIWCRFCDQSTNRAPTGSGYRWAWCMKKSTDIENAPDCAPACREFEKE